MSKSAKKKLRYITVDELPDDPLQMPPPYWRNGGSYFQLYDAFETLLALLDDLLPLHAKTTEDLDNYFIEYPRVVDQRKRAARDRFDDLTEALNELELKIRMKCELVRLMAAIMIEEEINQFCVFNLPKELVEVLERMSPSDKLIAALSHLGVRSARSNAVFDDLKKLMLWRNAFAHGHCVDRPVKSLRHNHLISPDDHPGVPDSVESAIKLVSGYVRLSNFIARNSRNKYTQEPIGHFCEAFLLELKEYSFTGNSWVYEVERKRAAR